MLFNFFSSEYLFWNYGGGTHAAISGSGGFAGTVREQNLEATATVQKTVKLGGECFHFLLWSATTCLNTSISLIISSALSPAAEQSGFHSS